MVSAVRDLRDGLRGIEGKGGFWARISSREGGREQRIRMCKSTSGSTESVERALI